MTRSPDYQRINELEYELGFSDAPPPRRSPITAPAHTSTIASVLKEVYTRDALPPFVDRIELLDDPMSESRMVVAYPAYRPSEPAYVRVEDEKLMAADLSPGAYCAVLDDAIRSAIKAIDPMRR